MNDINTHINKYFKKYKITESTKKDKYEVEVEVKCSDTTTTLENTIFIINTNDNSIYIDLINAPCDGLNGKKIVRNIINIANELDISNIELEDQSYKNLISDIDYTLKCRINLAQLNIILKGQTWYNTMGFVYDDFEKDKTSNEKLLNKSTSEFLNFVDGKIGKLNEWDTTYIFLNNFKELIEDKDHTKPFKEIFKELYNEENDNNNKCSKNLVTIYMFLQVLYMFKILKYNEKLKYNIKYDINLEKKEGGRRKKIFRCRIKTKKNRRQARKKIASSKRKTRR
jgi:hypothetical protein